MMNYKHSRLLGVLALTAVLGSIGCKKLQKEGEATAAKAEAEKGAEDKGAADKGDDKAPAGPCGDLASKLCDEAGKDSQTCGNAKTILGLLSDGACKAGIKDFAQTQTKLKALGKNCNDLVAKLCAGVNEDSCKMVTEKTKSFPPEQCTSMLEHVDEIIADLKKQEMANQPLGAEQQATIAAADAPSFGPADAKVTVVEFSDFQCPYCSRAANVTTQLKEKYADKVRFVFRHFPLSFHQNAQGAAEASMAAHSQGKFWEFHDKMFANQQQLDRDSLEGYGKELGLDMTKFKSELDSKQHEARVKSDFSMGEQVAVQGTPTMFVNGKRVGNPTDFAAVSGEIDAALGGS